MTRAAESPPTTLRPDAIGFGDALVVGLAATSPAYSLAAVIGVPHESHGEEIKAYVIKTPGVDVTEDELIGWCKEQMATYKYPRVVEFAPELPMTSTGKILKRELS